MKKAKAMSLCGDYSEKVCGDVGRNGRGRLPVIVDEINRRASNCKGNILEIGKLLFEAKKLVGYGHFQEWIETHFDFSYPCANNFMNVYRYCMGRPELVESIQASVLYAICAPGFPADLREHLFENKPRLENIGHNRIRDIGRMYKLKQIDLESPEVIELTEYYTVRERAAREAREVDRYFKDLGALKAEVERIACRCLAERKEEVNPNEAQASEMRSIVTDMIDALKLLRPAGACHYEGMIIE